MTVEIARALGHLSEKINEQGRQINHLYTLLHEKNVSNIDNNAIGIDGLAGTVEAQNGALDDLAQAVTELSK